MSRAERSCDDVPCSAGAAKAALAILIAFSIFAQIPDYVFVDNFSVRLLTAY